MSDVTSFWARRRAAVKAEEDAELRASEMREQAEAQEGKSDAEILDDLGLPDPASLQKGDDFSGFMGAGVPEHLRRIALRTLWRSNPVLANIDGLNEYDDDYRAAMLLSEPVKTAYQVGKGMKAHLDEMARKAKALEESVAEQAPVEDPRSAEEPQVEDEVHSLVAQGEAEETSEVVELEKEIAAADPLAQDEVSVPRRMRFRFEEASA